MKTQAKVLLIFMSLFLAYGADKGLQMKKENRENREMAAFNPNFSSADMCEWGADRNFALKINPAYQIVCAE